MGTVDPIGKLKQNEVCVILESGQSSGDVLVYTNPGLHFGDIHRLVQKYKQEFYGAAGFENSKKSLEELYMQVLALYNIAYDYATIKNKVRYCGFAWKVAGPVLCKFYLKKTEEKSISC